MPLKEQSTWIYSAVLELCVRLLLVFKLSKLLGPKVLNHRCFTVGRVGTPRRPCLVPWTVIVVPI